MKKFQLGDNIPIKYIINDDTLNDTFTITFIKNGLIYTCGHCFPDNAITEYGNIIYTSGFDKPSENEEIAIIKIDKNKLDLFRELNIDNNLDYQEKNQKSLMIHNRDIYSGLIIKKVEKKLKYGWQKIENTNYYINHQITKLDLPYYLVMIDENSKPGFSGSPWIVKQDDKLKLLGSHIGKTNGSILDKSINIAYVKPII